MNSLSMFPNLLLAFVAFSTIFTGINCNDGTSSNNIYQKCMTSLLMFLNLLLVFAVYPTSLTGINCYDETSSNSIYPKNA